MSMQDPISDMFCRMMNGISRHRTNVVVPLSKEKVAILEVFKRCGYISDYSVNQPEDIKLEKPTVQIFFRIDESGQYAIGKIKRVSKPSLRKTVDSSSIPRVQGGLGVAVISTSQGVLSCHEARKAGVGGEVYCYVTS